MTFAELMEKCAAEMPAEWEIQVRVEKGYGGVALVDPDGEEDHIDIEQGIEEAILKALRKAIDTAPAYLDDEEKEPC